VFHNNVIICAYSILNAAGGFIEISNGSTVGDFCNLYGQGGLRIGCDVMIASCVQIVPNQHSFQDITIAIKFQPNISKGIKINNGCWIGTNVVVLDGIEIGKNTVVGAGSIINTSVPDYSVAVGVPNRVVSRYDFKERSWLNV